MLLMQANHEDTGLFGWLTYQRRTVGAAIVAAFALGFSIGNGHTTQGAVQDVSQKLGQTNAQLKTLKAKDIPELKAEAGCEHWRADKAATVAQQAIIGANSPTVPIPPPAEIPQDNCPHLK